MIDPINKRRSVRSYSDKPVEKEIMDEILKAGLSAPSAHHKNPWEFIVVTNQETKEKLSMATPWSSFVRDASFIVAICGDPSSDQWVEDLSIAAQNMVIEGFANNVGSCYVQIYNIDEHNGKLPMQYVKEVLEIPDNLNVLFLLPFGYPREVLEMRSDSRLPVDKLHFEKY